MDKALALPEKRTEILYSRVTAQNKNFVIKLAEKEGISEAALVDHILATFRKAHAGNKKRPRRSS